MGTVPVWITENGKHSIRNCLNGFQASQKESAEIVGCSSNSANQETPGEFSAVIESILTHNNSPHLSPNITDIIPFTTKNSQPTVTDQIMSDPLPLTIFPSPPKITATLAHKWPNLPTSLPHFTFGSNN